MITTYTIKEVCCDVDDCFDTVELVGCTKLQVRSEARRIGWQCDGHGDLCPAHRRPPLDEMEIR